MNKRFGDYFDITGGFAFKSDNFSNSGVPVIRIGDISGLSITLDGIVRHSNDKKYEAYAAADGDILIALSGATAGKVGKFSLNEFGEQAYINQRVGRIRAKNQNPSTQTFGFYVMQLPHFQHFISLEGIGGAQPNVSPSEISSYPITLPPLAEQERIVEILSDADAAIAKAEESYQVALRRKAGIQSHLILNSAFTRDKLKHSLKQSTQRKGKTDCNTVLSVTNEMGFVLAEEKFGHRVASADVSNYKIVRKGQFSYNPSRLNVGSIARLDGWDQGLVSPMYVVIETEQDKLLPDFFLYWLQTAEAKQRIKRAVQGSVRESVGFDDLCSLPIPMPGLNEQAAICGALNEIDNELEALLALATALKKQKRGLMQQLLTGKLRVPEKQEAKGLIR